MTIFIVVTIVIAALLIAIIVGTSKVGSKELTPISALGIESREYPLDESRKIIDKNYDGYDEKQKARKGKVKAFFANTFKFPLYLITHPIQGYTEFKTEKKAKLSVAIFILILFVLEEIVAYKYLGPVINKNNPQKFNSLEILAYSVGPVILLTVSNWSVTTLMDGKGKMKEIFMLCCYSLFPVVILGFLHIGLSNVMIADEEQLILVLKIISWFLTAYMAFMGLVVVHEYSIFKTIASIILTVVAACVIMFVCLLIFDLVEQIYGFIYSLYDEIAARYF